MTKIQKAAQEFDDEFIKLIDKAKHNCAKFPGGRTETKYKAIVCVLEACRLTLSWH